MACTRTHAGRSSQGRRTGTRCEVVGRGRHAYGQATQAAPCAPCANRYRTFLSRKRIAGLGPSGGGDARAVSIGEPGESIGASGPTARPPQRIPGEKAPRPRPALRHGGPTAPVTSASAGARVADRGRGRGQPNTVGAWPACAAAPEPACVRVVCTRRRRADGRIRWQQIDSSSPPAACRSPTHALTADTRRRHYRSRLGGRPERVAPPPPRAMQTRSTDTRVCARAVVACPCLQRSTVKNQGGLAPGHDGLVLCLLLASSSHDETWSAIGGEHVRTGIIIHTCAVAVFGPTRGTTGRDQQGAAARRRRGHARPEPLYQPADTPSDPTLPRRPAGDAEQAPCTARGAATADGRRRPRPRTRAACMQGVHRTAASSVDTVARPRTHPRVARGARARPGCMHA
jgi:hypothetical protein